MNDNIIKTQIFRPSHLITTVTYLLMDNFCPCFKGFGIYSFSLYLTVKPTEFILYILIHYLILEGSKQCLVQKYFNIKSNVFYNAF